jgi:hypothetical protein
MRRDQRSVPGAGNGKADSGNRQSLTLIPEFGDYRLAGALKACRPEKPKQDSVKRSKPRNTKSELRASPTEGEKQRATESTRKAIAKPSASAAQLEAGSSFNRSEARQMFNEAKRLYLRVGDEVNHLRYEEWGIGVVMEVMTSSVPGGTCLARIRFQDGQLRCFNNDLDNESCCYYFGVRRYWNPTHGVNAIRSKFFLRG